MRRRHSPTRVILRLTPLLDLLLIVLFAQYMELQATTGKQVQAEQQRRAEALATRQEFARANRALQQRISSLEKENRALAESLETRQARQAELEENLRAVVEIARDQLRIPPDVVRRALADADASRTAKLRRELEQLRETTLADIIRYLRKNVEFRNHWDVWEVHINADDSLRLIANDKVVARELYVTSRDNFLASVRPRFDEAEPKSTVLILLSWGDASLRMRTIVRRGLSDMTAILEDKWARPKKFYVSELGYTPELP